MMDIYKVFYEESSKLNCVDLLLSKRVLENQIFKIDTPCNNEEFTLLESLLIKCDIIDKVLDSCYKKSAN